MLMMTMAAACRVQRVGRRGVIRPPARARSWQGVRERNCSTPSPALCAASWYSMPLLSHVLCTSWRLSLSPGPHVHVCPFVLSLLFVRCWCGMCVSARAGDLTHAHSALTDDSYIHEYVWCFLFHAHADDTRRAPPALSRARCQERGAGRGGLTERGTGWSACGRLAARRRQLHHLLHRHCSFIAACLRDSFGSIWGRAARERGAEDCDRGVSCGFGEGGAHVCAQPAGA